MDVIVLEFKKDALVCQDNFFSFMIYIFKGSELLHGAILFTRFSFHHSHPFFQRQLN